MGKASRTIRGRARNVKRRLEIVHPFLRYNLLSFELEVEGEQGVVLEKVEIHGPTGPRVAGELRGTIDEGDRVEVTGKWKPGDVIQVKRALNLTTESIVGQ
jgi:hypothetical protein